MEISPETVNLAQRFLSRSATKAIDDLVDREGTVIVVVHSNTAESLYQSASKSKINLFYSPEPMRPMIVTEGKVRIYRLSKGT